MDDAFALLEEKVQKAASALKRLTGENAGLHREIESLQGRLKETQKAAEATEKRKSAGAEEARRAEGLQKEIERLEDGGGGSAGRAHRGTRPDRTPGDAAGRDRGLSLLGSDRIGV